MSEVTEIAPILSSPEAIGNFNVSEIQGDISQGESNLPISRRRFLKGMGLFIAGEILAACAGPTKPP